ncbi:MAG: glycosyltransferase [Muribaculaceae bacterium]|nr:glycosyltransferase [Muribaculaceae bacterium]
MKKEQKSLSSKSTCKAANATCKSTKGKGKKIVNEPDGIPSKLLFETSWEVCNKIGGIYTVLSTKARVLKEQFGDNLIFIGPDVWTADTPSPYFKEVKSLLKGASKLKLPFGITLRTGRWDIPGSPIVVLIKFEGVYPSINEIYGEMWRLFGVDSLHCYGDYPEGCAFGVAAATTMQALASHLGAKDIDVLAHFNEWTTGMGLLWLRKIMPGAASLFTTHATSIGRSICGNGKNLYQYFTGYNGDQMARELNMEAKHSVEKAAAINADCFTAVSSLTADECAQLLDKRPEVVTPNGFEPDFVPTGRAYTIRRNAGRKRLLEIAEKMTGRKWSDDTLIVATSGRNEYRNKGLDVFLDSMAELSRTGAAARRDILALVLVPAWVREPNGELLINLNQNGSLAVWPDYLTHRLNNEDSDPACCRIAQLEAEGQLAGQGQVKTIFIPCYLDGSDGVVNISYYDLLTALDITVFASYYEPWGYTPLESIAFGVPTVTTDKSGFGQWVESDVAGERIESPLVSLEKTGVVVAPRNDESYWETAKAIAQTLELFSGADRKTVAACSKAASGTASLADWKFFISKYDEAFNIADSNRDNRLSKES